jgi:DNA ligase-1
MGSSRWVPNLRPPLSPLKTPIPVQFIKGSIFLPEAGLWLDAHRGQGLSFVSHAHADHVAGHQKMICSQPTACLLKERFGFKGEMIALAWDEPWDHAGHRLVLTPAGHVLGSAMIHMTRLSDGATLLYTGDFKLRHGLTAEPARPLPADTLIMECTFGQRHYRFPPLEQVRSTIHRWCQDALDHGETPMLLGYSLGKAQEIQAVLAGGGFRIAVHPQVAEMNAAYEALGIALPEWEKFTGEAQGRVLVFPPQTIKSTLLRKVKHKVAAMVSGWAINAGARFSYQVDEAFPLSDHADYAELLELPVLVKPETILTTHGNSAEFARDLRERGWNAWSLAGTDQMELGLAMVPPGRPELAGPSKPNPAAISALPEAPDSFAAFCATGESVAAASGRLKKTELLAAWFQRLTDPVALAVAVRFLAGKPAASREQLQAMGTGWAIIRLALLEATGMNRVRYKEISNAQADAGRTAFLVLSEGLDARDTTVPPTPWSLEEVQALFDSIRLAKGPSRKSALLTDAFRSLPPLSAQYVVKILTGDTRLGLKEGLLEEAIATAFKVDADAVREAHMLSGDLGETAQRALAGTVHETTMRPFQPVRAMLASPEDSAAAVWQRLSPEGGPVWLEDKYDGIRAQLHVANGRAAIFSRDLREMAGEFPEVLAQAAEFSQEVVLDGEIIAWAEGRRLNFFDLQKRLGRREADLFMPEDVPLRFVIFDLLWLEGRPLLQEPLRERRRLLEALRLPPGFERLEVIHAHSPETVQAAFHASKARGNEGLIAKDPDSPYAAGRRGKSWLKLKTSSLSLDVVVVAAEQGHGKRSHVLSDYTFAVRDTRSGELKVIGKAYSGLTDLEIEELTAHFKEHTLAGDERRRTVVPNLVLEIGFDSIQASKRHNSGLSLRFPRIKAIRRDKTPDDIDTLETAQKMAQLL